LLGLSGVCVVEGFTARLARTATPAGAWSLLEWRLVKCGRGYRSNSSGLIWTGFITRMFRPSSGLPAEFIAVLSLGGAACFMRILCAVIVFANSEPAPVVGRTGQRRVLFLYANRLVGQ
jgi:hypothetical protein